MCGLDEQGSFVIRRKYVITDHLLINSADFAVRCTETGDDDSLA